MPAGCHSGKCSVLSQYTYFHTDPALGGTFYSNQLLHVAHSVTPVTLNQCIIMLSDIDSKSDGVLFVYCGKYLEDNFHS